MCSFLVHQTTFINKKRSTLYFLITYDQWSQQFSHSRSIATEYSGKAPVLIFREGMFRCQLNMEISGNSISFGVDIVWKIFHYNKIFSEIETDDCCYHCCWSKAHRVNRDLWFVCSWRAGADFSMSIIKHTFYPTQVYWSK